MEIISSFIIIEYVVSIIWRRYQRLNSKGTAAVLGKPPATVTNTWKRQLSREITYLSYSIRKFRLQSFGSVLEAVVKERKVVL